MYLTIANPCLVTHPVNMELEYSSTDLKSFGHLCKKALYSSVWSLSQVFPPSACSVKVKLHFRVSLPTLSNQDRELNKEAVLSAQWTGIEQDPPVLVPTPAMAEQSKVPIPALPVAAYTTEQTK